MGCFDWSCPISRATIRAGDAVIAVLWNPRYRQGVATWRPSNYDLIDTVARAERAREFTGRPQPCDVMTLEGFYDDYGWLVTAPPEEDAVPLPEAWRRTKGEYDSDEDVARPETDHDRPVILVHRWAAEALVGQPYDPGMAWLSALLRHARLAGCVLSAESTAGQGVHAERHLLRTRLQGIMARGLQQDRVEASAQNGDDDRALLRASLAAEERAGPAPWIIRVTEGGLTRELHADSHDTALGALREHLSTTIGWQVDTDEYIAEDRPLRELIRTARARVRWAARPATGP